MKDIYITEIGTMMDGWTGVCGGMAGYMDGRIKKCILIVGVMVTKILTRVGM